MAGEDYRRLIMLEEEAHRQKVCHVVAHEQQRRDSVAARGDLLPKLLPSMDRLGGDVLSGMVGGRI